MTNIPLVRNLSAEGLIEMQLESSDLSDGPFRPSMVACDGVNKVYSWNGVTPIYKYDWQGLQLLYSTSRSNRLLHSSEFSHWYFTKSNLSLTNGLPDPRITTTTASTLTATGANAALTRSVTVTGSGAYTNSVWIKRASGTGTIYLVAPDGSYIDITSQLTSEFIRFYNTASISASPAQWGVVIVTSGDAVTIAFGQTEAGSLPTSWMSTVISVSNVTDYTVNGINITLQATPLAGNWLSGVYLTTLKPRTRTIASAPSAYITPNSNNEDMCILNETDSTTPDTLYIYPSGGTPSDGQPLTIRIKTTYAKSLSWDSMYVGINGVALPTSLTAGTTNLFKFEYDATNAQWDAFAVSSF